MKAKTILGIGAILAPTTGCAALGIILGQEMVSNPEMLMAIKVLGYLVMAMIVIGMVALILVGIILAIGWGLGLSKGDTRAALQAAIALARSSGTLGRLYRRLPQGLLMSGAQSLPPYYQGQYGIGMQVVNGDAMPTPEGDETEPAAAWQR